METLCIFGRLPKLSLAELESLYSADNLRPVGNRAAVLSIEPAKIDFSRLGGTVKFCKVLTILDKVNWGDIEQYLTETIPKHLGYLPEGKLKFGMSVYDLNISVQRLNASSLTLKKIIKKSGRSVRVIPNNELFLNSAQVLHNKLTSELGWELIFVRDGNKTIVGQNIAEQDIDAYAARDQARPKRDSRVGMLPPKLAQTIVNLASGYIGDEPALDICGPGDPKGKTILDPFCGTGVVLQEALLMGYDAYGSDLEPRMIEYSRANLEWLNKANSKWTLEVGDATEHKWKNGYDFVASEVYLGIPLSSLPSADDIQENMQTAGLIVKKFLSNLASQTPSGFRLCLAVPAWKTKQGNKHLKMLENIGELGYTRVSFTHSRDEELIYHRDDQYVAREIIVLERTDDNQ